MKNQKKQKKNFFLLIAVLVILLVLVLALIFSLLYLSKKSPKVATETVVSLTCSNNSLAQATYFAPSDSDVMDQLKLKITKDAQEQNYDMSIAVSGSGAKFQTADGQFVFWQHQGEYTFYQNDEPLFTCQENKNMANAQVNYVTNYLDATYLIEGEEVTLQNGVNEMQIPDSSAKIITRYFGNDVRGDFNQDGFEDVAFLITQETGGSGAFFYTTVALGSANGYYGINAILLGDRIAPQTTNILNEDPMSSAQANKFVVNFAQVPMDQPMSDQPSEGVSQVFVVINQQLFEENQDTTSQSNAGVLSREWFWQETLYNDDKRVTPAKFGVFAITLNADDKVSVKTDCNTGFGGYKITDSNKLTFENIASTMMFCEGSKETDFFKMLNEVSSFFIDSKGDLILELKLDSGSMIFKTK